MQLKIRLSEEENEHLCKLQSDYKRIATGAFLRKGRQFGVRGEYIDHDLEEAWHRTLAKVIDDMISGKWETHADHDTLCRRMASRFSWAVFGFREDAALGMGSATRGRPEVMSFNTPVGEDGAELGDFLTVLQGEIEVADTRSRRDDVAEAIATLPERPRRILEVFTQLMEDGSIEWREKSASWVQLIAERLSQIEGKTVSVNSTRVGLHKARNLLWSELVRRAVFSGERPNLAKADRGGLATRKRKNH